MVTIKKRGFNVAGLLIVIVGLTMSGGCTPAGPRSLLEGEQLMREGKFEQAVDKLHRATSIMPTNALAWNFLGLAYHGAGGATNALQAYQKALALDPELEEVRYNLGCLYLESQRLDEAKSNLITYTLRREKSVDGWVKLGTAHLRAREWTAAERSFGAALRLDETSAEGWNGLGLVHMQRNRPREAAQSFAAALKHHPAYPPALLNLGIVYQQNLNNRPQAIQKYREYLATHPPAPDAQAVARLVSELEKASRPKPAPILAVAPPADAPATSKPELREPPALAATAKTNESVRAEGVSQRKIEAKPEPEPVATKPVVAPLPVKTVVLPPTETATAPAEVVSLPEPPVVKQALDVAVTAANGGVASAAAAEDVPPPTVPAAEDEDSQKRGFFRKLNPLVLLRRDEQKQTPAPPAPVVVVTPLEPAVKAAPQEARAAEPIPAPPPQPRYSYQHPSKPQRGDSAVAGKHFARGVEAHRAKQLGEAVSAYRQAIEADPAYFEAYYNLGLAAMDDGLVPASLRAYEFALTLDPNSTDARFNFALALKQSGYAVDAARELERLVAVRDDEARAYLLLGNLYAQQLAQPRLARQHYQRVLALMPQHAQAQAIRSWLLANP